MNYLYTLIISLISLSLSAQTSGDDEYTLHYFFRLSDKQADEVTTTGLENIDSNYFKDFALFSNIGPQDGSLPIGKYLSLIVNRYDSKRVRLQYCENIHSRVSIIQNHQELNIGFHGKKDLISIVGNNGERFEWDSILQTFRCDDYDKLSSIRIQTENHHFDLEVLTGEDSVRHRALQNQTILLNSYQKPIVKKRKKELFLSFPMSKSKAIRVIIYKNGQEIDRFYDRSISAKYKLTPQDVLGIFSQSKHDNIQLTSFYQTSLKSIGLNAFQEKCRFYFKRQPITFAQRDDLSSLIQSDTLTQEQAPPLRMVSPRPIIGDQQPFFVVDGTPMKSSLFQNKKKMDPDDIASINVIKGDMSKAIFGDKGENGTILIETKIESPSEFPCLILNPK